MPPPPELVSFREPFLPESRDDAPLTPDDHALIAAANAQAKRLPRRGRGWLIALGLMLWLGTLATVVAVDVVGWPW